ncbi:MAG: hypothetical protein DRI69_11460 [Bacteroidetes bacterium]|nr:MAG: hypothetical protein DRI69_11460 [Bacteroidota bacterium]
MYNFLKTQSFLLFWICLALTPEVIAQKNFEVTPDVRTGYAAVMALNFDQTRMTLRQLSEHDPDNLMQVFLEDYIDFFTLFITEDRSLYQQKKDAQSRRLDLLKDGPEDSPWYRYTRAEVHLHRALLRIKFGEYLAAATDINKAFKLLRKNESKYPDFAPTYKSIGVLRMGVGTIPEKYMWAVKLFSSLEGTIQSGIEDIERSISLGQDQNALVLSESQYLYAQAMVIFENDPDKAWAYLKTLDLNPGENVLECYLLANFAMRTGRNDQAVDILIAKPNGPDTYDIPYMELMLGRAMLFRGDINADLPLLHYVGTFEGENFIKEAYQKLAWNALLNNDPDEYHNYMDDCVLYGRSVVDEDKHALKEAESGKMPNPELLGVRLLFDGSYFEHALSQLSVINKSDLNTDEILEYEYRKARILHKMEKDDDALRHYMMAIQLGKDLDYYYACNAALQSGLIYASMGKKEEAEAFFKKCLSMHPDDYQTSIHHKAKAGLNRLKTSE